jgi:DNA-binding MarR family transcriptional regulator
MQSTEPGRPPFEVREASMLLREILNLSADFEADVAAALSVNRTDFDAMQHLVQSGALSPSEIARRLGVTTAAATAIVDRLVTAGHASREPHPTDRRGVLVKPTPSSAARAMGHIEPLILGVDRVLDDYTPEEQATITGYLRRVVASYAEARPAD